MGGQICCRVLCIQFPLLLKECVCRTPFGGSLVNVPFCVSPLVKSSRVEVLRGTEATGDAEGAVILLKGSKKLGLAGLEPFPLCFLALQPFISIHHMSQQLTV